MKYYFITGTGSGLGRALAEEILKIEDCFVRGISRHNTLTHQRFSHIPADLSQTQEALKIKFDNLVLDLATEVVLINNAGSVLPVKYLGEAEPLDLISAYNLNIVSPALLSNEFIRTFFTFAGRKLIVNVSSGAAKRAVDGWGAYCSSKAALEMLTAVAALERDRRNSGFLIASIAPGVIDTGMQEEIRKSDPLNFSRNAEFKGLYENGQLQNTADTAVKLLEAINNFKRTDDAIFRITV